MKHRKGTGLTITPEDPRDFDLGSVYGTIDIKTVPNTSWMVANPVKIKNQGQLDFCAAYMATEISEDQEWIELGPKWQFAMIKFLQGDYTTWTASSGTNTLLNLTNTINMSGTAGYRVLDINITETATGSGVRKLISANVGGTEKFGVNGNGNVGIGTSTPSKLFTVYNPTATSTAYISSGGAGLGGEVILEDIDGAGCTSITTLNGVISGAIVTCP